MEVSRKSVITCADLRTTGLSFVILAWPSRWKWRMKHIKTQAMCGNSSERNWKWNNQKADTIYYRRKIILALIEVFDGSLKSTDCEKLLFNFCQQTGKNHYDFFPYKYGPFSFLSYYDKRRMIELGLLKSADDFQLSTTLRPGSGQAHSYLNELTPADKTALLKFKSQIGDFR